MKVLIVSLLKRKVTSDIPAARPRIIYEIAIGLVKKGHQVSLLGTADSQVNGVEIIPVIEKSFVDMPAFERRPSHNK